MLTRSITDALSTSFEPILFLGVSIHILCLFTLSLHVFNRPILPRSLSYVFSWSLATYASLTNQASGMDIIYYNNHRDNYYINHRNKFTLLDFILRFYAEYSK